MAVLWLGVEDLEDPENPDAPYALEFASFILYRLTGEKYPGVQEAEEWYGYRRGADWCGNLIEELTVNSIVPQFIKADSRSRRTINLRRRPVLDILSVRDYESGEVLNESEYDLRNHAFINKKNGFWNMSGNGYVINYLYGMNPPEAGKRAVKRLAEEIIKSISDPDNCSLPERVTSVSRQGVNYTVLDPQEFINDGKTGLYEVDLFINAANPAKALKRPRILVPGSPQGETIR